MNKIIKVSVRSNECDCFGCFHCAQLVKGPGPAREIARSRIWYVPGGKFGRSNPLS